jgi:hypothetical protein
MKQSMWWGKKKRRRWSLCTKEEEDKPKKQKWNAQSDGTYPQEKKTVKLMAQKI